LEPDSGMPNKEFFVHLYRFPGADEDEMTELATTVAEILKFKADNREVPPELWRTYRRYIKELPAAEGRKKRWDRNDEAIRKAVRYAGMFVIRSNIKNDPFAALHEQVLPRQALCLHDSGLTAAHDDESCSD